jgi:Spy/CpxP family protein refolding chaperone
MICARYEANHRQSCRRQGASEKHEVARCKPSAYTAGLPFFTTTNAPLKVVRAMLHSEEVNDPMKTLTSLASASLLALSLAAMGCGGSTADTSPQTAQNAATLAPVGAQTHGMVKLAGDALGDVPLRPEQRAELEKLAADAEARHQSLAPARKDLVEAVAAQVEAGKIDRTALQPKIDAASDAWVKIRDDDRAALERVHAILDATQRAKFVEALQARFQAKRGDHAGHHGHGEMKQWAEDLKLTDAQKDQIKSSMRAQFKANAGGQEHHEGHSPAEMKAHHGDHQKIVEAFKSDRFVMDEVAPKGDARAMAAKMSGRMIHMVETVMPVLTPEQRTIAAQKIRTYSTNDAALRHGPF